MNHRPARKPFRLWSRGGAARRGRLALGIAFWSLLAAAVAGVALVVLPLGCGSTDSSHTLLNVSYDPTREFYSEYNARFIDEWQKKTGETVSVRMSHGGSGKQARSVIDGLEADVVTLALAYDIDAISRRNNLIEPNWQQRLPHNSAPYTSTIVFLVRKGNPKQIHDWPDLIRPGIAIVTPDPRTSGGARWNYLAAWGSVLKRELGDLGQLADAKRPEVQAAQEKARQFVTALYHNVPSLEPGARGATMTFVQRGLGDVLLAWESEALMATHDQGGDRFEIVTPPTSILAQPPVSVVDAVVNRHGTRALAEAYLKGLYEPASQELAAKFFYRPAEPATVSPELMAQFGQTELFGIDEVFGGWQAAQRTHFDSGGTFEQIYQTP